MDSLFRWLYSPQSPLPQPSSDKSGPYEPSVSDVLNVKRLIRHASNLPLELIDLIIDYAEYWPHTTTPLLPDKITVIAGRDENQLIMRSLPLGYVSSKSQGYELVSDSEDMQKYSFKEPFPWPEDVEIPNDATNEVLQHWLARSHPRAKRPCRKIVFTFTSHDQGWGGEPGCQGTYRGAFSWFDVGLERICATRNDTHLAGLSDDYLITIEDLEKKPLNCILHSIKPTAVTTQPQDYESKKSRPENSSDRPNRWEFKHPLVPDNTVLQKNLAATRKEQQHTIVWSADDNVDPDSPEGGALEAQGRGKETGSGEFVRNLKPGDVVTVWAKARFAGWYNRVNDMKIDVYWAV